jgi:hypothetical protein
MKTKLSVTALILLVVGSAWTLPEIKPVSTNGQSIVQSAPIPVFAYFRTHRLGRNGATATWAMQNNGNASGFIVQRTYEDPTDPYSPWDDLCSMPCTGNGLRTYRYNDEGLSPGFISYRIVAMDGVTPLVVSEVSTIQILQH